MGTQEVKLKAIADAIREKDGTTDPIPAADFPNRIRAISTAPEGLHTITVEASDPDGGTVSGGGVALGGTLLAATANAADKYEFEGWQENGETVSTDTRYIFPAAADRVLTAKFTERVNSPWTLTTLPVSSSWRDVVFGDNKFVAISDSTTAAYSTDGINWTSIKLPSYALSAAYGNGRFVTIPEGTSAITSMYSADGINWAESTLPLRGQWLSVAYGNGKFVAVGYGIAAYSTNGINWTKATPPSPYSGASLFWSCVTYGGSKFAVASTGSTGGYFAYSANGISWTNATTTIRYRNWESIAYGNGKFVTLANGGTSFAYSADGAVWYEGSLPFRGSWTAIAYGDNKFVAVAPGDKFAYSEDGVIWTEELFPLSYDWRGIAFGNGTFVTVAKGSDQAAYSTAIGPANHA